MHDMYNSFIKNNDLVIMRNFILIGLLMSFTVALASEPAKNYQIDLIVFTHKAVANEIEEQNMSPLIKPDLPKAIALQPYTGAIKPYHFLPSSSSKLRKELWALTHNGPYRILCHYSWVQPDNNQRPVILPTVNQDGWSMEGTLRVRQANFYKLDTDMLFSSTSNGSSFVFSQKQQLKNGKVYYLDHPQAGMLIKIHRVV